MFRRKNSLIFRICYSMCLVVCTLVIILIALHITLFEKYVSIIKENELIKVFQMIDSINETDSNITESIENLSLKYNVIIRIFDANKEKKYDSTFPPIPSRKISYRKGKDSPVWFRDRNIDLIEKVQEDLMPSSYKINKINNVKEKDVNFIDLVGKLNNGNYIVASMPVSFIKANIYSTVLFILFAGFLAIVFCSLLSYLLAKKISKPIVELSEITGKMANLDFTCQCDYIKNDEIGVLANNINLLSAKLSNTINSLHNEIDKVKKIDNTRKNLIANISHELKTPIFLIQNYSEGLITNVVNSKEDVNYYCEVISDECNRLSIIVNELLELSKLEAGKLTLQYEEFDLNTIIVSLIKNSSISLNTKSIGVKYQEGNYFVYADKNLSEKTIRNLFINAIDYTVTNGYINIDINFCKENNICRLSIKNKGENIPEEKLGMIWDSFYKIEESRNRQYGGTGIGLSIVKATMEAHNKNYGVYNTDDGVVFFIEFDISK